MASLAAPLTSLDKLPFTWPSFGNIHRRLELVHALYGCFTLKMDGSNLGLQIELINSVWKIHLIIGRTTYLFDGYASIDELPKFAKYGNGGDINGLIRPMFVFAVRLAEQIGCTKLTVTGEVFRHGKQKFPSWHPFGYLIGDDPTTKHQMLDLPTWEFFKSLALSMDSSTRAISPMTEEFGTDYQAMLAFLETSDQFNIFPPLLMFHGQICDGIRAFEKMLMENEDPHFEGFFIVYTDTSGNLDGLKLKGRVHEEQKRLPDIGDLSTFPPEMIEVYDILSRVFNARCPKEGRIGSHRSNEAADGKVSKEALDAKLITELTDATRNILSKMQFDPTTKPADRKKIIESMVPIVCAEMTSHYTDDSIELPWSKEAIMRKALNIITPIVMRIK
jgi:hypothetical protein